MNNERNGEFVARDNVKIGFFVVSIKFVYLSRRMLLRRCFYEGSFCVQHCAGVIFLGEIGKLRESSWIFPPKIMLRVYLFVLVDRKKNIGYLFVCGIVQIYFARK